LNLIYWSRKVERKRKKQNEDSFRGCLVLNPVTRRNQNAWNETFKKNKLKRLERMKKSKRFGKKWIKEIKTHVIQSLNDVLLLLRFQVKRSSANTLNVRFVLLTFQVKRCAARRHGSVFTIAGSCHMEQFYAILKQNSAFIYIYDMDQLGQSSFFLFMILELSVPYYYDSFKQKKHTPFHWVT
jgi:hypothetical protein